MLAFQRGLVRFMVLALTVSAAVPLNAAQPRTPGTILIYGDSLSAAYGIAQKDGWVELLASRLKKDGTAWRVVNASISGETSSGGATRIAQTLAQHKPAVTVLALGANDGLRGLPIDQLRRNLATIIEATRKAGGRLLLVGMRMPPNYGDTYAKSFENVYRSLAQQYKLPLVPFLLEGVADKPQLFQPDQLHPLAEAQPFLMETIWRVLGPELRKARVVAIGK